MNEQSHEMLLDALAKVFMRARNYEYHDFKNTSEAMPKMALIRDLEVIIKDTKEGKFDN